MSTYAESVNRQYGASDICARILEHLRAAGKDVAQPTRDDLAPFDEFHQGGRDSTRTLARYAELRPGARVLDVGSGIGGPARTLAAEFGCRVTGIDLTAEFCRASGMLNELVGLAGRIDIRCGNALDMPFESSSFDVVWSQNTLMNIGDKAALFHEIGRVLRPGGRFAFEAVLAGPAPGSIHFPVFWADTPAISFLPTPEAMDELLTAAGLRRQGWEDTTSMAMASGLRRREALLAQGPATLGLGVIVPVDFAAKLDNGLRNLVEGRTRTAYGVYAA